MKKVQVAVNGYGVIGKRVTDAVACRMTWSWWASATFRRTIVCGSPRG